MSTNFIITSTMTKRILGIDPGTKEMGVVVLEGKTLLSYGVHTLRNGERPHDVIGQAKRIVLGYVAKYGLQVVAFEKPLPIATRRGAILNVIADELRERGRELNLEAVELGPAEVRQRVVGNPKATKIEVAEALVQCGFEELRPKLPRKPARSALGFRPGEKYWLHMFDALAVAVAASQPATTGLDGGCATAILVPGVGQPDNAVRRKSLGDW